MVQFLLKPPHSTDVNQERFLIELQGNVESCTGSFSGDLGTLEFKQNNQGKAYLSIGHHILEGKRVIFQKPFALVKMPQGQHTSGLEKSLGKTAQELRESGSSFDTIDSMTELEVTAVIKHKYIFQVRPEVRLSEKYHMMKTL